MHESPKQRPLVVGVLTGLTAIVGGIEPATADVMPLPTEFFGTMVANSSGSGFGQSGDMSPSPATASDPTTLDLFNTLGGTRELTGVTVTVASSFTEGIFASLEGSCSQEGSGSTCQATATNNTTFSVGINIGGPFSPLTQVLSATASDSCVLTEAGTCALEDFDVNSTLPSQFVFQATAGQLSAFLGPGTFTVTPGLSLLGEFSSFSEGSVFNTSLGVGASSTWSGTIDVAYEFRVLNAVPEPASLFLVGAGLAGLGFARRKRPRV